jgi:predicted nucleic acid-binding protein
MPPVHPRCGAYPTTQEHHRAAQSWLRKLRDQRISYTDAASFAVMTALQCRRVLTFDSDFVIAGFTPWQREG